MKFLKSFSAIHGIVLSGLVVFQVQAGVQFTSLVSFNQTNGANPQAALMQGVDGNFYGTTAFGGSGNSGIIFQMTPSGVFTNLISFNGTNGAAPRAGLVQGLDGNFYGTTYNGGSNNFGTVFQATTNGTLTTPAVFSFGGGGYPIAGLVQGSDGNFYGTTSIGGTNSGGTVFQVTTNEALSTLVSFDLSGINGNSPYAGLIQGSDGNFYGTTFQGGINGYGTIFQLTTNGTFATLHSFNGTNDGANPYAGLIQGPDGNFYGTTFSGGTNGYGTVFEFATNGTLMTLVSFDITNGANSQAGLVRGLDGDFYGTTTAGGAFTNESGLGYGTVFRLGTNGALTTLVSFNGTNGASPQAGLIQATDGNFYGTTADGGTNGYGTVFRISITMPPPPSFLAVGATGSMVTLTWSATVGEAYQMSYKTNLNQAVWINLNDSFTATNAIMKTFDAAGSEPRRFYRIVWLP